MNLAFFWWWLEPPKRGVTIWAPGKGDLGKRAQTFFYLKLDIKSKLFTDANLSMTKKKISPPSSAHMCSYMHMCAHMCSRPLIRHEQI